MAISDIYTARNGNAGTNAPSTTTTTNPILSIFGTATKRLWVVGIRVELGKTSAAAGQAALFQLARPALTTPQGSTSGATTPAAHDFSAPASLGTAWTTWTTAPTLGTVLWEQELPQTTGSAWEEFPPLGYEWGVPAQVNGGGGTAPGVHVFATCSDASSTPLYVDVIWSE
jgi:hypothetical protein